MGGKTQASALRCLPFGTLEVPKRKIIISRFRNWKYSAVCLKIYLFSSNATYFYGKKINISLL